MIADPGQLRDDHANVLAPRGQLDAQQLLNGAMPGHLIQGRADVVLAVGDRHILVVVEMLAQLLEARVQITNIGRGLEDSLAVELENQAQGRMRGRMLGPEVERPRRSPGLGFHFRSVEQVRRHHESLSRKGTFTSRAGLKPGPKTSHRASASTSPHRRLADGGRSSYDSSRDSLGKLCRSPRPRNG